MDSVAERQLWVVQAAGREGAAWAQERDRGGVDTDFRFDLDARAARGLSAFGERKGVEDWVLDRRCKVGPSTLRERLRNGVPPEVAITTPPFTAQSRRGKTNARRGLRILLGWRKVLPL